MNVKAAKFAMWSAFVLFIVLMALLTVSIFIPVSSAHAGSTYYTTDNCVVSSSLTLIMKMMAYAEDGDLEAFNKLIRFYPDKIVMVKAGVPVYLVDSVAHGVVVKIRPRGMTAEVWTLRLMLRN